MMRLDFFPTFLVNQHFRGLKLELFALNDKLKQIGVAVKNELDFYDDLKVAKPARRKGGVEDGTLSEDENELSFNQPESILGKRPKDSALEAAQREVGNITELNMKVNEATGQIKRRKIQHGKSHGGGAKDSLSMATSSFNNSAQVSLLPQLR